MIPETKSLKIHDKGTSVPDSVGILEPEGEQGKNPIVLCNVHIQVKNPDWTDFSIDMDRNDIPAQVLPTFLRQVARALELRFVDAELA
jgi:hypothetical protein